MKKYPDRLLVLDLDGCVTSVSDGTYFNPDPELYHPSKRIVEKLKTFCKDNNAKILISSNWRKFDADGYWKNSYGTYSNPLPEFKKLISEYYFDTLSPKRHINKSTALVLWLDENKDFNGKFVIFDDDMKEQFQNTEDYDINKKFILIDSNVGITDDNLSSAKELLTRE